MGAAAVGGRGTRFWGTVLLWVCFCWGICAQRTFTAFERINNEQGLSQGMVFSILQSREGFLWMGTKGGLNRFDGYHCQVFSPDPFNPFAIGGSEIRKIFEDSRGLIWLNYPQGIDIYDPKSGNFFHLPKSALPIHTGDENASSPLTFAETPDGAIWVTDRQKLWRIAPPDAVLEAADKGNNAYPTLSIEAQALETPSDLAQINAYGVFFSQRHGLLVGSKRGLYAVDWKTLQARPVAFPDKALDIVGEDATGRIWLRAASPDVLFFPPTKEPDFYLGLWDGQRSILSNFKIYYTDRIRVDMAGNLLVMRDKTLRCWGAAAILSGGKPLWEWRCYAPFTEVQQFDYETLMLDRSGIVWLGTNGYGVLKVRLESPKFSKRLSSFSHRHIYEDPTGLVYLRSDFQWAYADTRFASRTPNPWYDAKRNRIPSVFDTQGNGWGNEGGILYRMDARTKAIREFPMACQGIMVCRRGQILGVSESGLMQFDVQSEQTRSFPFEKKQASPLFYSQLLYEDAGDDIWIFSFEGLIRATPQQDGYRYTYYKNIPQNRNSLSNDAVLCVVDDPLEPQHYLWVGTKGGGLNRLDKQTGGFKHYKTEQGLPDNVVYGALTDHSGHLWLSTNKGLCRFHVREESTKNFTAADGLQDNEFNTGSYLKTRNGALIFGGVNGLTAFHPDSLKFNAVVPQTHIVGMSVNNEAYPFTGQASIDLSHRQDVLTIEFAALEFSNPAQNRYRYQLLRRHLWGYGENEAWVESGYKNSVQFANLSSGEYQFRVIGSNNDGVWSEAPATLFIVLHPPWWASWWAYGIYLAAALAAVWLFYRAQLRRRLEQQEALRLKELDQFKNRLFTNITHEFRTPLTVMLGTVEQLATGRQTTGQAIELLRRNGQNLLRLINQVLDLSKLEADTLSIHYVNGDLLPYLRYISESLHSFANAQNVLLRVESTEAGLAMDYDPERIRQIIYNLLSNAIKFTPGGGKVTLSVSRQASAAVIKVRDTGVGIPPDDLPHIFERFYQAKNLEKAKAGGTGIGLALTKELVGLLGGEISAQSAPGQGSIFELCLPITQNAPPAPPPVPFPTLAPSPGLTQSASLPSAEGKPLLLLIEDNPDVMEYLSAALGDRYQLMYAYNGRAGIEKALDSIPDMIVSDVMMPEKDGFEVCETLKNDERTSHVPLVLLTAKAAVENRIAGLRRGADAYMSKPFHEEELMVVVENLLEGRRRLQAKYSHWTSGAVPAQKETPQFDKAPDLEDIFLEKVNTVVQYHLSDARFTVDDLCRALAMSQPQLHRKLTALTGKNATLFIRSVRLAKAKELLLRKEKNVSEVAYEVGFDDPKYFSRVFSEEFGVVPSKI